MALYYWSLGAALFANVVSFVGISYWDQIQVAWYAFLAIIATAYLAVPAESTATVLTAVAPAPARVAPPPRPAHAPDISKPVTSYGRMVTGRWAPKSTTK